MLSDAALVAAIAGLAPLLAIITYTDLKDLRIPNWAVVGVFLVFLATGSWGLPTDTFLWRIGYAAVALLVGVGLYNLAQGQLGAGDLKLIAALVPFLSGAILLDFLALYIAISVVGTILLLLLRRLLKGRETGFRALGFTIYFPAGVYIGLSILAALLIEALFRFGDLPART